MLKNITDVYDFATSKIIEEIDTVQQDRIIASIASDANTKITMKTHDHYTDRTE